MHRVFPPFVSGIGAFGLLVLRIVTGLAFIMHGWGKIQSPGGPFHWMDQMPDAPPGPVQALAVLAGFGGGIRLMVGFLTPLGAFFVARNIALALAEIPF